MLNRMRSMMTIIRDVVLENAYSRTTEMQSIVMRTLFLDLALSAITPYSEDMPRQRTCMIPFMIPIYPEGTPISVRYIEMKLPCTTPNRNILK